MTDNKVIKALECCSEAELKEDCKKLKCPFFDNENYNCMNVDDENAMYRYSLDLINRQKSQILKEQNKNSKLRNERNHLKAEIEELQAEIDKQYEQAKADILGNMADGGTSCHWCIEQHKAKAIKAFAEDLAKDIKSHRTEMNLNGLKGTHRTDEITYQTVIEYIDNLVKEMVGDCE